MSLENAQKVDGSEARVADSIAAAAGLTGYSERLIQRAKSLGCEAFRGSRVYVDELVAYIEENGLAVLEKAFAEDDEVSIEIARERLRKIRFENDVAEGRYIRREEISDRILEIGLDLKQKLRTILEDELPQRIQGKDAREIRVRMREVVDEICDEFSHRSGQWTN